MGSYTAYGFLGGKEVKAAGIGNLGLQDREYRAASLWGPKAHVGDIEREALRWIQKYIHVFGGDSGRVTL